MISISRNGMQNEPFSFKQICRPTPNICLKENGSFCQREVKK